MSGYDVQHLDGEWVATCKFRTDAAQLKWSFAHPDSFEVVPHVDDAAQGDGDRVDVSLAHLKELFTAVHILGNDYAETAGRLKKMQVEKVSSTDDDAEIGDLLEALKIGNYL